MKLGSVASFSRIPASENATGLHVFWWPSLLGPAVRPAAAVWQGPWAWKPNEPKGPNGQPRSSRFESSNTGPGVLLTQLF